MWTNKRNLQEFLIAQEIVTVDQVRHAMAATLGSGTTWLEYLLLSREVDEDTIARCGSAGVGAPPCDLNRLANVPSDVLAKLPRDLAVEHRMVPLSVEPDRDLCVGMVDPFDLVAVREVEFFLGVHLLREVVPATPLAWALTTYYGAQCALWPRQELRTVAIPGRQRLARGSVATPISGEFVCKSDVEKDQRDPNPVAGGFRVADVAIVPIDIADQPTQRIVRRRRRRAAANQ